MLSKAKVYFNIGREGEAKKIIREIMKGNEKNIPVFKRKLEELQANYMMMDNISTEDGRIFYKDIKKKHFAAVIVTLIAFTLIWFSISLPGPLGEISQFLDFHYVMSENYVEDVETITDISITDNKEIDIETNNNKFILYCDHRYYDDIIEKYYIGDVVKIKYLPNTKNILDIELF